MALFKRKKETERQLTDFRARRDMLAERLARAERSLAEAVADRQRVLLESAELDIPADEPIIIERLRDEAGALQVAIGSLDGRIAEVKQRLVAERDRRMRQGEADLWSMS
jgi:hypothetical protein